MAKNIKKAVENNANGVTPATKAKKTTKTTKKLENYTILLSYSLFFMV